MINEMKNMLLWHPYTRLINKIKLKLKLIKLIKIREDPLEGKSGLCEEQPNLFSGYKNI
jgi:hypothetical protein